MPDLTDKMNKLQSVLNLTDEQAVLLFDYIDSALYVAMSDLEDRVTRSGIYDPNY